MGGGVIFMPLMYSVCSRIRMTMPPEWLGEPGGREPWGGEVHPEPGDNGDHEDDVSLRARFRF
jgi:hypothetical protein